MRRRVLDDYGDDYTPATDLVFSMFAMSVLLLALFGASGQVSNVSRTPVPNPASPPAPGSVASPAPPAPTPPEPDPPLPESRMLGEVNARDVARFTDGADHLSGAAVAEVAGILAKSVRAIEDIHGNQLVFQISTDLHVGGASRVSAFEETAIWSKDLMEHLEKTRLPLACVFIEPLGETHAAGILKRTTTRLDSGAGLDRLRRGAAALTPSGALSKSALADHWIKILTRRDADAHCDTETVLKSLSGQ